MSDRPHVGILVLDTAFPRIPGDAGNLSTWDFPVRTKVVAGAYPRAVIEGDPRLLQPFIEAARELEAEGVHAITTTCGFLALYQEELAGAVNVPVLTSSLLQVPWAYQLLKEGQAVGILTVDARCLTPAHMKAVGAEGIPTIIAGTEGGQEFTRVFSGNQTTLDSRLARDDLVEVAQRLVERHPQVGALVLECANMPPYARAIQQATGLPVFDLTTLIRYIHQVLFRTRFA